MKTKSLFLILSLVVSSSVSFVPRAVAEIPMPADQSARFENQKRVDSTRDPSAVIDREEQQSVRYGFPSWGVLALAALVMLGIYYGRRTHREKLR